MMGIIEQLRSEHASMAKLLDALDRQVSIFDRGGTPDYEIVQAVNRVGAAPGDLVAILEALKQAGALRAELVVI